MLIGIIQDSLNLLGVLVAGRRKPSFQAMPIAATASQPEPSSRLQALPACKAQGQLAKRSSNTALTVNPERSSQEQSACDEFVEILRGEFGEGELPWHLAFEVVPVLCTKNPFS